MKHRYLQSVQENIRLVPRLCYGRFLIHYCPAMKLRTKHNYTDRHLYSFLCPYLFISENMFPRKAVETEEKAVVAFNTFIL